MMLVHNQHNFKETKIQSVSYCELCGGLRHQELITFKPKEFNARREIDPLDIFSEMKKKIENINMKQKPTPPSLESITKNQRKHSIEIIKFLVKKFNLDERTYHACISLMDYLIKTCPEEFLPNTDQIVLSSFLVIIKYGENGFNATQIKNYVLNSDEKKENFKIYESKILKWIKFDIGLFYVDYDILNLLVHNGIIFEGEKVENLPYIYFNCFLLLNSVKEKYFCLKYDCLQIAFSIIYVMRNTFGLDNNNYFFEDIYDYHFDCFKECFETLKGQIKLKKKKINRLI